MAEQQKSTDERRSDALALSGPAAKITVSVVSAGIIALGALIFRMSDRISDLTGELDHVVQIEQVRHESIANDIAELRADIKQLKDFRDHGKRFTAGDGKRHDRRLTKIEEYIANHERWGRELTGGYTQIINDSKRRLNKLEDQVDRLEKWQGIKE